jgi:hypothetical protein
MEVTLDKKELLTLIKEAVREVFQEEVINIFLKSIPSVSQEEMQDIKKLYGKPSTGKEIAYSESIEI